MDKPKVRVLLTIGLLALAGAGWVLARCTAEQSGWMNRNMSWSTSDRYPKDYEKTPLGTNYDTPKKVALLRDQALRQGMTDWFKLRQEYLKAWRDKGEYDDQVVRVRHKMATIQALIQYRAQQLQDAGEPLS